MFCKNGLFTSECVTCGHPDKVCDQISDAILDACLEEDPDSRVAVECLIGKDKLVIMGEITTKANINYEVIARTELRRIGYTSSDIGFDCNNGTIEVLLNTQSPDIAMGVDTGGAGDQGMMYGYACNETADYLPFGFVLAKKLARQLEKQRVIENDLYGSSSMLRPDGKTQVTMLYKDGKPVAVDTVLISTQHSEGASQEDLKNYLMRYVIKPTIESMCVTYNVDYGEMKLLINPTGKFVIGGPAGDTGLTGRKIIVDTYGGYAHHGGGCFSGKDPSKVDRSGAYAARRAAKWAVYNNLCRECEVQIAYAIGVAEPVSIVVNTFDTAVHPFSDEDIANLIRDEFDFTPNGIIASMDLKHVSYKQYASNGHFGGDVTSETPWEHVEKTDNLTERAKHLSEKGNSTGVEDRDSWSFF